MSLVGSLEDLGLGDILQIVSLSRKSGLLRLRSEQRRGCITLVSGQVRAARLDGEAGGLREVLVDGGFLGEDEFKLAFDAALAGGLRPEQVLAERAGLSLEHVASLLREQVEQAVIEMFSWRVGEFSFEVNDELEGDERERLLPSGVDAQYFAMQATRLGDEARAGLGPAEPELAEEPVFSGEACAEREVRVVASPPRETRVPVADLGAPTPLVVVDAELAVLEWLKSVLDGLFARIHIFQDVEAGLARVRQYLVRGERPTVLLGSAAAGDRSASRLARLRALCPTMPVVRLCDRPNPAGGVDAVVLRPPRHRLVCAEAWPDLEREARALREALAPWAIQPTPAAAPAGVRPPPDPLERLVAASRQLRAPVSQRDVMSVVLGFAAESFPRVALFVVREGHAVGRAQRGLAATGGPDDALLRRLRLPLAEAPCLQAALAGRAGQRIRPREPGDLRLVQSLGEAVPAEIYVAPIESGGRVAALLYADALPELRGLGDTRALEIVLHEASLALDHAVLERALAEREEGGGADPRSVA